MAETARIANLWRYRHLPYLYSLHFDAALNGGVVVSPVAFEFGANDAHVFSLDFQFMWGAAILAAPVYQPDADTLDVYLPPAADWFYLYSARYGTRAASGAMTHDAPRNDMAPVFARGNSIIPRQVPAATTAASRQNNFQLLVACS